MMMLELKRFLKEHYGLSDLRCQNFKARAADKTAVRIHSSARARLRLPRQSEVATQHTEMSLAGLQKKLSQFGALLQDGDAEFAQPAAAAGGGTRSGMMEVDEAAAAAAAAGGDGLMGPPPPKRAKKQKKKQKKKKQKRKRSAWDGGDDDDWQA